MQKLARILTGLCACLVLSDNGLYQKVGAVFRMLDEFVEDVSFLCGAIRKGLLSEAQTRFLQEFFRPEFDHRNPFLATQRRSRVPRRKIQAAFAGMPENPVNPSGAQELARTLANAFSGYVHGTSECILDLCAGDPPRYQLQGMPSGRRQTEFEHLSRHYFYRGLMAFMDAAGAFGCSDLLEKLVQFACVRQVVQKGKGWSADDHAASLSRCLFAQLDAHNPSWGLREEHSCLPATKATRTGTIDSLLRSTILVNGSWSTWARALLPYPRARLPTLSTLTGRRASAKPLKAAHRTAPGNRYLPSIRFEKGFFSFAGPQTRNLGAVSVNVGFHHSQLLRGQVLECRQLFLEHLKSASHAFERDAVNESFS